MPSLQDILDSAVPAGRPGKAEQEHAERMHNAMHAEQDERHAQLSFFAAFLCDCRPWPVHGVTEPPQAGCVVHGQLMMNQCTGAVYLPGLPPPDSDE